MGKICGVQMRSLRMTAASKRFKILVTIFCLQQKGGQMALKGKQDNTTYLSLVVYPSDSFSEVLAGPIYAVRQNAKAPSMTRHVFD